MIFSVDNLFTYQVQNFERFKSYSSVCMLRGNLSHPPLPVNIVRIMLPA